MGGRGASSSGGGSGKQKATNSRIIDNMNEAQIDNEIKNAKASIARAEKLMDKNSITNSGQAKALQNAFPLGVGGDGWSAERRKAQALGIERDTKKAKAYSDAYSDKKSAETRLKALENAKKAVQGTGKTLNQAKAEKAKKAVENAPKTLNWKQTQKGGWTKEGGFAPKIIKAGNMEIHGSDGLYSVFKDGQKIGQTDKLSKAKAYAESKK